MGWLLLLAFGAWALSQKSADLNSPQAFTLRQYGDGGGIAPNGGACWAFDTWGTSITADAMRAQGNAMLFKVGTERGTFTGNTGDAPQPIPALAFFRDVHDRGYDLYRVKADMTYVYVAFGPLSADLFDVGIEPIILRSEPWPEGV